MSSKKSLSKMFRKRSKNSSQEKRQNPRERAKAEQFMTDYDLSLYIHHIDLKMTDESGNTAMHVAVMNCQQKVCRMLIVLCAPYQIWKVQNKAGLTSLDLCTDEKIREDLMSLEPVLEKTQEGFVNVDDHFNDVLVESKKSWEPNERVLFALDGGGIRAVITMQILIHIDNMLNGKLVDYIDDIGGTSCGGVISLLISSKNRKVEDIRKLLLDMREKVFIKQTGKVVWPKYSATGIEYVAKHVTAWENSKMSIIKKMRTFVTVADTRMVPPQLLLFRSYMPDMPEEAREHYKFFDPEKVELWKALRCTTAAPFFFESFHGLSDGGLIANNPTLALISDFLLTNKLEKTFAKNEKERDEKGNWKIGCVVSIGTGIFPTEKIDGIDLSIPHVKNPFNFAKSFYKAIGNTKNMLNMLVKECTASNGQPVRYAREWCHSINIPYFRFSPHLSQGIALDELDLNKIMQVMWETEQYIATHNYALMKMANFLKKKPRREEEADIVLTPPLDTWNTEASISENPTDSTLTEPPLKQ
ncbi:unnamed protein product [Caenorhabditis bovis]|uniref:PNPLA domain-containing protein n=1 Tax=Caenorhabditis bovis TaxID=2654633 RepID=A0A8S1EV56_9PELO|nr:unnamed protein product [Caenorhabditis bovis]